VGTIAHFDGRTSIVPQRIRDEDFVILALQSLQEDLLELWIWRGFGRRGVEFRTPDACYVSRNSNFPLRRLLPLGPGKFKHDYM
jgi:hypothetical protein